MVFPTLLCPLYRLRRETPVWYVIRAWRTAMPFGRGNKNALRDQELPEGNGFPGRRQTQR
jgi:hypothetical protein